MKRSLTLSTAVLAALVAAGAQAQDSQTIVAQYYRCDQAREDMADRIVRGAFADVYNAKMEAGGITGWGWSQHIAGGAWRRILFHTAPTRDQAFEAWGELNDEVDPVAANRLLEICPSHDDYIWTGAGQSATPPTPGGGSVSTYLACNMRRETEADDIVSSVLGPVADAHQAAGDITGWTWASHDIGGRFRRILVIRGTDPQAAMNGRDAVFETLRADHEEALDEFSAICGSHVDYVWNSLLPEADG